MRTLTDARAAYDDALAADDGDAAAAVVTALLDGGMTPTQVITDVIAEAQRDVGARWQRGEWTVAEEHAATAIAVSSTKIVRARVGRIPPHRGRVVIACAEREWHELPAMMIDCALRAAGYDTTLLGASTSPLRLNQYLQDIGPEAVAVSCSVLMALPAARRFIEASTASGVPILVGGPAFGPDDRRARALGATAWAADAPTAVSAIGALQQVVSEVPKLPSAIVGELAALDTHHHTLTERILSSWWPALATDAESGRVSREFGAEAVRQLLHAVAAALLTGDPRPIPETVFWTGTVLQARGIAARAAGALCAATLDALADLPLVRALLAGCFPALPADWA